MQCCHRTTAIFRSGSFGRQRHAMALHELLRNSKERATFPAVRAPGPAPVVASNPQGCHALPIQWGPVGLSVWEADEWSRLAGEHFVLSGVVTSVSGPCPGRLVNLPVALLGCRAVEHLPIGL